MRLWILVLNLVINKYEANPVAIAANSIRSGARLAGAAFRNKAVRRIKSGGEHIGAAIRKAESTESIFEKLKDFFEGTNL